MLILLLSINGVKRLTFFVMVTILADKDIYYRETLIKVHNLQLSKVKTGNIRLLCPMGNITDIVNVLKKAM